MRTSEFLTLPSTLAIYDPNNEQTTRRTIEQAFQDLRNDIIEIRDKTDKVASLSMKRHQFLLMGSR